MLGQQKPLNNLAIDSIIKALDTITNPSEKINFLITSSVKNRYSEKTISFLNKALSISEKLDLKNQYASIYYSLGNYYYYNSKLDSSSVYLNKAEEFATFDANPFLVASILSTRSGICKRKGDVSSAIAALLNAKESIDKIDTTQLKKKEIYTYTGKNLVINNSLANLYNQIEDHQAALLYYDLAYQAVSSLESKKTKISAGSILSNRGDLLIKMKRFNDAFNILIKSKELKIEGDAPPIIVAGSELNLGIAETHLKKYSEALISFNSALNTYSESNHQSGIAYVYASRGLLYNNTKEYSNAISDCEKAKSIAISINNLELQLDACQCLSEAYKEVGDFEKAFKNQELYLAARDSFISEKNIKQLTQLQMQYDFDKQQEHQKIEADKKEQQRKLFLYLAIAAFIIIILLGFFFIKNRKKNFQISEALQEKEILLKEIHHRVKNNLQVVSSLLSLQQRQTKDTNAQQALQEGRNRVKAMALIHQNLYQDNNLVGVDLEQYITKLVSNLVKTYKTDTKSIQINTNIDKLKLDVDTIIPLGLIINELISNSLKYAFIKKDSGEISVALKIVNNLLKLVVSDNGVGLPENFSIENTTSLGYKLIRSFSQKLEADFNIESTNKGTLITLIIKKYKAE
ncbi:MAG: hypothetical protein COB12_10040 [Flavobacterium sp.]|nr:MAG: hypothetical protein COB12_10040 [Flavobacterium sp.]